MPTELLWRRVKRQKKSKSKGKKKHRTNISVKYNDFRVSEPKQLVEMSTMDNILTQLKLICSSYKDIECFITLPLGELRGRVCQTIYDQKFFSFEGIPFAEPPLGELRFRAPVPVQPWKGIKDCVKCASKPLQLNPVNESIEGSEDCLYLNVYTKRVINWIKCLYLKQIICKYFSQLHSEKPLPVMVFIPGGSFRVGGARRETLGPDYFMNEDVLLVTFNYRLCSLGVFSYFFC